MFSNETPSVGAFLERSASADELPELACAIFCVIQFFFVIIDIVSPLFVFEQQHDGSNEQTSEFNWQPVHIFIPKSVCWLTVRSKFQQSSVQILRFLKWLQRIIWNLLISIRVNFEVCDPWFRTSQSEALRRASISFDSEFRSPNSGSVTVGLPS